MQQHKDMVIEAMQSYEELPQERNELYKRHYISIPFDLKVFEKNTPMDETSFKRHVDELAGKLEIKFDVVLGSDGFFANQSEFVRVDTPENANSVLERQMHASGEDKYVAYINAKSDKITIIDVPDGKSAKINMLVLNSNRPLTAKVFVNLGKESKLELFEYHGSASNEQTCSAVIHEIRSGESSNMELNVLYNENEKTISIASCKGRAGKGSHIGFNSVYIGASQTRVRNTVEADGNEGRLELNEIIFGSASQKFDIETKIINAAPHTNASLESKAALMGSSFCILKGFAKINKGAEKAKSYVHERGILLDKNARIEGLPDMSVDESDVKATHSSATSPIDPESVFYLMSKGIGESGVKKLMVTGFFANNLAKIRNNLMKVLSMSLINSKLENGAYGMIPKIDIRNIWIGTSDSTETDMFQGHYKYRGTQDG